MAYLPGYRVVDLPEEQAFALADQIAREQGRPIYVKRWYGGPNDGRYYFDDQPDSRTNTVYHVAGLSGSSSQDIDYNPKGIIFGEIEGYPPGSHFASREAMRVAGLHRHSMAGISGSESEGADAIVLSGGYEDDEDLGDEIIYTGQGGNRDSRQVADQTFTRGNLWLAVSHSRGVPVRVIRGFRHLSPWSPESGYVYSGLYTVDQVWHDIGQSGFKVYRYRLLLAQQNSMPMAVSKSVEDRQLGSPKGDESPGRKSATTSRVIRDTRVTNFIKELYGYRCQVCSLSLDLPAGSYAEGAHIQPLGRPHNGPDTTDNVLCLCPNHHVLFDNGAFVIDDDFQLIGEGSLPGKLNVIHGHEIGSEYLRYHREHFQVSS